MLTTLRSPPALITNSGICAAGNRLTTSVGSQSTTVASSTVEGRPLTTTRSPAVYGPVRLRKPCGMGRQLSRRRW
jgi:hypothetical protein